MNRKIIAVIGAAGVILVGGIAAYYGIEGSRFVKTDDARVAADTISILPEISGKLLDWRVHEGDSVEQGQILGSQDLGTVLGSGQGIFISNASVSAEKATIRSPIQGLVIQSSAVVGQMTQPGTTLAIIADTTSLYIAANIKEGDIDRVSVGEAVDIGIDAFPGTVFKGRVASIGEATASSFSLLSLQGGSGNYTKIIQVIPIKIAIANPENRRLIIGMNTTISITTDRK